MEAFLLALASSLGPALIKAIEKLGEKAVEPALKKGLEPFQNWLTSGYDQAKARKDLHDALMRALDDLKEKLGDDYHERLFITIKLTGLDPATYQMLASASVEMIELKPNIIPTELLTALDLDENRRETLAHFLFLLREHLADVDGFRIGIDYANQLASHGLLAGLTKDMSLVEAHTKRTARGIDALVKHFGIATDEHEVLQEYLETLQGQLQYLPLPLADPGSATQADAELRKIFVPLTMRDNEFEKTSQINQKRLEHHSLERKAISQEDEESRSVQMSDVISRHEQFALIGGAGSGKTTLLKMVALAFVENRAREDFNWEGGLLFPIFLRLRNFGTYLAANPRFNEPGPGALTSYLHHHFSSSYGLNLTTDFFPQKLKEGNCLVLLDGLDEVSQGRSEVAQQVNAFICYYRRTGNRFGLASRPRGFASVENFLRPSSLGVCDVNPLDVQGICKLTENLLNWIVNDPQQLAEDKKGLAQKILASPALTELASTPLFCTALTLVYKYHGSDLPQRRVDVLQQVVDLLLGFWAAQKPGLSKGPELAVFDGTEINETDLEMAVANKRGRLSYLAYQMQIADQKTQVDAKTAQGWLQDYLEDEEGVEPSAAENWAKGFLRYAHEHSGLFVEQEGPGMYVFTHEGFREYLAARELHDLGEYTFIQTLLDKILDDSWEQVILLAAAYKGYSRRARRDLIDKALQKVEDLRKSGYDNWLRSLVMTGKMTGDMDKYLPVPKRMQVESELRATMISADLSPETRATAADTLDELGYLPNDLHTFVPIPDAQSPEFHIGRYQVTNVQYQRFLKADDFAQKDYWINFPKFSELNEETGEIKPMGDWGDAGWGWLQRAFKDEHKSPDGNVVLPRYWNDPRFGINRKGVPVVGITWYEANAYCKWLLAHWDELPEAEENPGWKPKLIRLPTEREWALAAGGEDPSDRYPWDKKGQVTTKEEEILRRANVRESGISRTTPVAMYPLGISPHGVWDMGGNVWEWQANYYHNDRDWLALRGGSWGSHHSYARVSAHLGHPPGDRWEDYGFRHCVLRSRV